MAEESLSILAHGPAGKGKTHLGYTGPTPTLFLDVEMASKFIPKRDKVFWDPMREAPPAYDGTWKFCVVKIKDWSIAKKTEEYLRSNRHPFRTVVLDSISETLVKAKEKINGDRQFKVQHWGQLSQNLGSFLRSLRDITADEDSPIEIMYIISASKEFITGEGENTSSEWRPLLEGSTKDMIAYLYDMVAFINLEDVPVNPNNPGQGYKKSQTFFTGSDPKIVSKCRPPGVPPVLVDWTLEQILHGVFPPDEPAPQAPAPAEEPVPATEGKPKGGDDLPALPGLPEG